MNPFAQRKVLIFGLLGALGCLLGWAAGEGFLAAALPSSKHANRAPSLASPKTPNLELSPSTAPPLPGVPQLEARKPPPPSSPDFDELRKMKGGKVGKVTLTLKWFNQNDLDLHCVDPNGNAIYWDHRDAENSSGTLDVDANGPDDVARTNTPIENIRYLENPPLGRYRVFVQYFAQHVPADPTKFAYEILTEDLQEVKEDTISFKSPSDKDLEKRYEPFYRAFDEKLKDKRLAILGRNRPIKELKEFHLPGLRIAAPPEVVLFPDQRNKLTVVLERDERNKEPVSLTWSGDPAGLLVPTETVPGNRSTADLELAADKLAKPGMRSLRIVATTKYGAVTTTCNVRVEALVPELRVAAPANVELRAGGDNRLAIRIARQHFSGPVTVSAIATPKGVRLSDVVIPSDKDSGEIEISAESGLAEAIMPLRLIASGGEAKSEVQLDLDVRGEPAASWSWLMVLIIGCWTALLAVGLSLALVAGQNRYLGRPWLTGRQTAILLAGGIIAGFVAGGIGQTLFSLLRQAGVLPQIGFLIGWLLLGGLLGRGIGFFIPNLHKWRACGAGVAGGLLGALGFILISRLGDMPGRLVGAGLLGFCIGLMVALVEAAFRKAWLEVHYGPREIISVNLGPEPIKIGGDGKACTIFARGAAPVALRFWTRAGKVVCEDVVAGRTEELANGSNRKAGQVEVVVRTSANSASRGTPPNSSPSVALPSAAPTTGLSQENPKEVKPPVPPSPPQAQTRSSTPPPPPSRAPIHPAAAAPPKPTQEQRSPPPPPPSRAPIHPAAAAPPKPTPAQQPPPPPKPSAPPPKPPTSKAEKPDASVGVCPLCRRKVDGAPGKRYCIVCDHTF